MNDGEDQLLYNAAATTQAGEFYLYHIKRYDIDPHCNSIVLLYHIVLFYSNR